MGKGIDERSPQGPVTELSDERSWGLLERVSFGRLGLSLDGRPEIFPIDYHVDGRSIVFRTAAGTKLRDLTSNPEVALEVDERNDHGAWSVVLKGLASVVDDADEIAAADRFELPNWVPVREYVYVRITPTSVMDRSFERHVRPQA
jgi:nitroimidazol reductase NimA-like FMN-containing flavoprotein (pyridoxamine 5'-phosphate oxidase superfamily)